MPALFGKSLPELTELLSELGQKPYRARQLFDALYKQRVTTLEDITTYPVALRESLAASHTLGLPEIVQTATSIDGTERYLMRMADGETVETVWMPDGDGVENTDESEAAADQRATKNHARAFKDPYKGPYKYVDPRNRGALAEAGYRRATDELGHKAVENRVSVNDLHATILHLLGMDHTRLTYHFNARNFRLTDVAGNVVRDILA